MKYILTACLAFTAMLLMNSCGTTTGVNKKPAYINNETLHLPGEKITDITLISVCMSEDKAVYEIISQRLQQDFSKRGITSDMRFYDAKESPAEIGRKISETTKPYYLVIDKINSGTQKDEMNNDFITKQVNCMLQKKGGGHIADFTIAIDRNDTDSRLGKTIASLIINYLSGKHLI